MHGIRAHDQIVMVPANPPGRYRNFNASQMSMNLRYRYPLECIYRIQRIPRLNLQFGSWLGIAWMVIKKQQGSQILVACYGQEKVHIPHYAYQRSTHKRWCQFKTCYNEAEAQMRSHVLPTKLTEATRTAKGKSSSLLYWRVFSSFLPSFGTWNYYFCSLQPVCETANTMVLYKKQWELWFL